MGWLVPLTRLEGQECGWGRRVGSSTLSVSLLVSCLPSSVSHLVQILFWKLPGSAVCRLPTCCPGCPGYVVCFSSPT